MVLLLSQQDVRQVLNMRDAIDVVARGHIALARHEVVMPVRLTMRYDDQSSELEAMPAYIRSLPALGMKMINFVGTNVQRGLPAISALIAVLDPDNGRPLAIMDGAYITAVRTAAASAMATRLLARPEAAGLAIIGTGVQARSHLSAMAAIHPFQVVSIFGRHQERLDSFYRASQDAFPSAQVRVAASVHEAVKDADVIVTVTTTRTPILYWDWIRPGAHINAIGSHSPDVRELASDVVAHARLFVDSREANLRECGDFLLAIAEGAITADALEAEIGDVAAGLHPGRRSSDDVTLYKSGGIALQDVATAQFVYARARERGLGMTFEF